jgi:hypothetical protein
MGCSFLALLLLLLPVFFSVSLQVLRTSAALENVRPALPHRTPSADFVLRNASYIALRDFEPPARDFVLRNASYVALCDFATFSFSERGV